MRSYQASTDPLVLPEDEIHVWTLSLAEAPPDSVQFLSEKERERAAQYKREVSRQQFVAGRSMLRQVLSRYLSRSPGSLILSVTPGGKPCLVDSCGIEFNLSHSSERGLLAVGRWPSGIDLESMRPLDDEPRLVNRFYSQRERDTYQRLPADLKTSGFFRAWTCKEALLKAVGRGLWDLESCCVELDPRLPARIWVFDPGPWQLAAWSPWEGFTAALAVRCEGKLILQNDTAVIQDNMVPEPRL